MGKSQTGTVHVSDNIDIVPLIPPPPKLYITLAPNPSPVSLDIAYFVSQCSFFLNVAIHTGTATCSHKSIEMQPELHWGGGGGGTGDMCSPNIFFQFFLRLDPRHIDFFSSQTHGNLKSLPSIQLWSCT